MHDEAHYGLEVVSVEGHLTLFGHVDPTGVPRPPATPHALYALPAVRRLKRVDPTGEAGQDVGGNHLKEGRVGRPYLTPRVTQSDKTLWYTPMKNSYNIGIYTHTNPNHMHTDTNGKVFLLLFLLFCACIYSRDKSVIAREMHTALHKTFPRVHTKTHSTQGKKYFHRSNTNIYLKNRRRKKSRYHGPLPLSPPPSHSHFMMTLSLMS